MVIVPTINTINMTNCKDTNTFLTRLYEPISPTLSFITFIGLYFEITIAGNKPASKAIKNGSEMNIKITGRFIKSAKEKDKPVKKLRSGKTINKTITDKVKASRHCINVSVSTWKIIADLEEPSTFFIPVSLAFSEALAVARLIKFRHATTIISIPIAPKI